MRKTKEQKAITLIALIITIVVLLILAVVAINAVTGDGIIQHAVNAKEDYEQAQDEEQDVLAYYEQYLKTEGKSGDWIQNKTIVKNVKTGQTIEVGEKVNYIATGSGYELGEWGVLGVENGKLLLVSKNSSKATISDYRTAITLINDACKGYDKGIGAVKGSARSINVQDINRITGYNPLKDGNGKKYDEGKITEYGNKVTYSIETDGRTKVKFEMVPEGDDTTYITEETVLQKGIRDLKGQELTSANPITIENTEYGYNPISLTSLDAHSTKVNGISDSSKAYKFLFEGEKYFLADVCANIDWAVWGLIIYRVRVVGSRNEIPGIGTTSWAHYSNGTTSLDGVDATEGEVKTLELGVRSVITLEEDVQLTKQSDGSYNIE